ncbi:MAG: hypothetical protein O3C45_04580 [Bacteroidetes bacterium]|nr:hypothetical protein [Bacteroidota bacterium]MDA0874321.1 hypothetical protein [Bacteroidota bacterium]
MLWHFSGSSSAISDRHRIRRTLGLSFLFGGVLLMTLTGCDSEAMLAPDTSDRDTALRVLGTDARMMAFVDVENQMTMVRDLAERNTEMAEAMDEMLKTVLEETGIRVEEDVHGIYVAIQDFSANAEGAALAFVDFDQDRAAEAIKQESDFVRVETEWPVDAFTLEKEGASMAVAFVEGQLVMLATSASRLQAMLDRAYADAARPEMDALMAAVADHDSWMVVRHLDEYASGLADGEASGQTALLMPIMTSLQDLAVGSDQDAETMESRILIRPVASVAVDDYAQLITGARAMMRMQVRDLPAARDLIDDIDIRSEAEWVRVDMSVQREDIEEIGRQLSEEMSFGWN